MTEHLGQNILSDIIIYMKYAKFLPNKKRRETWEEIIDRNKQMHLKKFPQLKEEIEEAYKYVYDKKILPSMRSLQFSGKPIEISPVRLYNCSYCPINHPDVFSEIMFLLLSGCGVGYSVQLHHIKELPEIIKPKKTRRYLIGDSIEGWADAVKVLVKAYLGSRASLPIFDFSDIRPKGTLLKTSGGRAPGPEPLKTCLHNIQTVLDRKNTGEKLTSLEIHDIICYISEAVLAGGIRRSSAIALFSLKDSDMLACKFGKWYEQNPQRARANNSVVLLRHKITQDIFLNLWEKIAASKSGEPGFMISNDKEIGLNPSLRGGTKVWTTEGFKNIEELEGKKFYVKNMVGQEHLAECWLSSSSANLYEIILNDGTSIFCTKEHKWPIALGKTTFINSATEDLQVGTRLFNSMFDKKYPSKRFKKIKKIIKTNLFEPVWDIRVYDETHTFQLEHVITGNCAEISLPSCSFCNLVTINVSNVEGQEDFDYRCKLASRLATLQATYTDFHYLRDIWKEQTEKHRLIGVSMTGIASGKVLDLDLKQAASVVVEENARMAELLGINKASRCTTVKPEGTSSLVLGCSSGIHSWHAPFYIRRITIFKHEPLYQYLAQHHPELVEDDFFIPDKQAFIKIPIKAPEGAITRLETALQFLERVKKVYKNWILPGHRDGSNTNNVSATVTIKDGEWERVGKWFWENKDFYTALSVLPYSDHVYKQPPFEEITEEEFNNLTSKLKEINLTEVKENSDNTTFKEIVACGGGSCEL